jgi:hypothetical protein
MMSLLHEKAEFIRPVGLKDKREVIEAQLAGPLNVMGWSRRSAFVATRAERSLIPHQFCWVTAGVDHSEHIKPQ